MHQRHEKCNDGVFVAFVLPNPKPNLLNDLCVLSSFHSRQEVAREPRFGRTWAQSAACVLRLTSGLTSGLTLGSLSAQPEVSQQLMQ